MDREPKAGQRLRLSFRVGLCRPPSSDGMRRLMQRTERRPLELVGCGAAALVVAHSQGWSAACYDLHMIDASGPMNSAVKGHE